LDGRLADSPDLQIILRVNGDDVGPLPFTRKSIGEYVTEDTAIVPIVAGGSVVEVIAKSSTAGDADVVLRDTVDYVGGDGGVSVDHHYGGPDALRAVDAIGSGLAVDVLAYRAEEYDTGVRVLRDSTTTLADGRFLAPLRLNLPSVRYAIVFRDPSARVLDRIVYLPS
jgi:hypothetical protein